MKFAAIDIGSNGVRFQVTNVIRYGDETTFKRLHFMRFPLRLGTEVFKGEHRLSDETMERFVKLMTAFKLIVDLYKVDECFACATSAMREAANGSELIGRVKEACGLEINIISGDLEADMINKVIAFHLTEKNHVHIDVGGGSTELILYKNKIKLASKSFQLGSVRFLNNANNKGMWDEMNEWVRDHLPDHEEIVAIGTGGNIKKLSELINGVKGGVVQLADLEKMKKKLTSMDYEERMNKLKLNADRADVIIPASRIYINAMKQAGAKEIIVPNVGLKDGIMTYLYEKNISKMGVFKYNN
ncbi:phosphatase [Reichenbachiella sp. 5M10]|uniref:Ppx/GppA phosphatase family protein n=1 Tax=Reichenbachiella sp. 5M10 TaxID=1889772 RepID=UPI000C161CE4|nr:phosphatase [Reichenbachiella sp. 5M10]PIB34345.1 phosphatase [Reichenbachiella sp. 5M10]